MSTDATVRVTTNTILTQNAQEKVPRPSYLLHTMISPVIHNRASPMADTLARSGPNARTVWACSAGIPIALRMEDAARKAAGGTWHEAEEMNKKNNVVHDRSPARADRYGGDLA
ncbi:MAG: hypothetical protein M5U09_22345 [Gammaproteobacteria bacterium]|nr:hypothetical protein [Gammaproteobacteria bacterium]